MLSLLAQVCNWAALRLAKELSFGSTHMRERWDILSGATSWVFYGILWQTPMADPPVASNMPEIRSIVVNCFHMFPSWIFTCMCMRGLYDTFPVPNCPIPNRSPAGAPRYIELCGGWVCTNIHHPNGTRPLPTTSFVRGTIWGGWRCTSFSSCKTLQKKIGVKYQDGQGRTRYKGNGKALKNSQILSLYMSISFPLPLKTIQEIPTFVLQLIG